VRKRLAVEPVRVEDSLRLKLVAQYGETAVVAFEADETRRHDMLLNGTSTEEPCGILHGGDMVARR
jgi:hypothetical protein